MPATDAPALLVPIRRRSPQDIAARAHRFLDAALGVHDRWESCGEAAQAAGELGDALEGFAAVESGLIHWEAIYHHLRDEANPHEEALAKLADEAVHAMGFLFLAIASACGLDVANAIRHAATTPVDASGPQISPAGRADAPPSAP